MSLHPIFPLTCYSDVQGVRSLLQTEPNAASAVDVHGWTPLHWAACKGNVEVCQMLLQCYHEAAAVRDHGCLTPLHWAAKNGNVKVYPLLISAYSEALTTDTCHSGPQCYDRRVVEVAAAMSLAGLDGCC
jgi:ankyrin repeat protein